MLGTNQGRSVGGHSVILSSYYYRADFMLNEVESLLFAFLQVTAKVS